MCLWIIYVLAEENVIVRRAIGGLYDFPDCWKMQQN